MPGTSTPDRSPATHSHTLDRGLRALEVLSSHPDGLSVAELAAALGTHRAAVYRLLGPLGAHHLVRREHDGRYTLAPGLIELAGCVRQRLREASEPVLRRLADEVGATTALTIRDGEEAVVALVVPPQSPRLHLTYRVGLRHPLHQGAPGHALLAATEARSEDPPPILLARERGYAVTRGELLPGATGVAVAIATPGHEAEAAISAVWIEGLESEAVALQVVAAAREIGEELAR